MILYNVTSNINESINNEWLAWMREVQIPRVLATGKFDKAILSKVLLEEEMDGITYAVQYHAVSFEALNAYYDEYAPKIRAEVFKKFADKVLSFRTELVVIEEF